MKTRVIGEIGSCWGGKKEYALEAIDIAKEIGLGAVKFQLFPNEPKYTEVGNIWMPPDLFIEVYEYAEDQGVTCSASVFDQASFDFLFKMHPPFIKFAYSQKDQHAWIKKTVEAGIEAIVSCDVMTERSIPWEVTKLYCLPVYPVPYQVSFENLFPRFDGFSDHTLGITQTLKAVYAGAQVIEKHWRLEHKDAVCPDADFAISPEEMHTLMRTLEAGSKERWR